MLSSCFNVLYFTKVNLILLVRVVAQGGGGGEGHSITKHTGGLARRSESKTPPKYLSKNSNILKMLKSYPLNIPKVQSKGSKISNLGQNFFFTENCTPNYPYEAF